MTSDEFATLVEGDGRARGRSLVGKRIAEVQAERATAERALGQATRGQRLTKDEMRALVAALGDTVATLRQADPVDTAEADRELGSHLTHHPDGTVRVGAKPRVYSGACRRGDLNPHVLNGH